MESVFCPVDANQVLAFIEEVIGEPAYVAGNSLGGYIGTNLAANHPSSVLGLALLNATPFWAFRQPTSTSSKQEVSSKEDFSKEITSEKIQSKEISSKKTSTEEISSKKLPLKEFFSKEEISSKDGDISLVGYPEGDLSNESPRGGFNVSPTEKSTPVSGANEGVPEKGSGDWLAWDGMLPAPKGLFGFGAWYFDRMRDPRTVKSMLGAVYSNPGMKSVKQKGLVGRLVGFWVVGWLID